MGRYAVAMVSVALVMATGTSRARGDDLEPYLADSLEGLVAQLRSKDTSYPLKRLAARRVIRVYPERGPDALVEFLHDPVAQFNVEIGKLLFQSRLPNSKTEQLIGEINKGMTTTTDQLEAFAEALAWPGNDAALPVLRKMAKERSDTAETARFCIAQVSDRDGPGELLKLLGKPSGAYYLPRGPRSAADVLRRARWEATNRVILDPTSIHGIKDIDSMGLEAKNALAWPGNKALANAYMGLSDATINRFANGTHYAWSVWSLRWELPAVRTRDPRCLERARKRFTDAVMNSVNADGTVKPGAAVPYATPGVEAANEETLEAIDRMLNLVERANVESLEAAEKLAKEHNPGDWNARILMDPGGSLRSEILRGLCVNPVPHVSRVVGRYRDHEEGSHYAALAMLRAGEVEGMGVLVNNALRSNQVTEELIVYAGVDFSVKGPWIGVRGDELRQWWEAHRDDPALAERVARVNRSDLLNDTVERLKGWP